MTNLGQAYRTILPYSEGSDIYVSKSIFLVVPAIELRWKVKYRNRSGK